MYLEDKDQFKIINNYLTITRNNLSGSTPVDPSFIKEKLGFLGSIINKIYRLFSDNYWKKKTVTIQDAKGSVSSKTMYVLESRLSVFLTPNPSKSPAVFKPSLPTASPSTALATPLTAPSKIKASHESVSYTKDQLTKIADANLLYTWIGKLKDPNYVIKTSGKILSIESRHTTIKPQEKGVQQFDIDTTSSTGAYNLLACTSLTLSSISPNKWSLQDGQSDRLFNYDKYIAACNEAIELLKAKKPPSADDEINLGLINAGLILAKGFQQILNGSTKNDKTFTPSRFNQTILTNYVMKFLDFGTKRP